jgi:AcrR family transcriptional regulator
MNKDTQTRRKLTRERIVKTAIRLADELGAEKLSMRALAGALGVEAMSLYNHVANKEDLLDAVVDKIFSMIERPSASRDWKAAMTQRATSMHATFRRHPWSVALTLSRLAPGPNNLSLIEASLETLCADGFSDLQAFYALCVMDSYIYGFHVMEQNTPFAPGDVSSVASHFLARVDPEAFPRLGALASVLADGGHNEVDEFRLGFDLLVSSIDQQPRLGKDK